METLKGKNVLVVGATGGIGSKVTNLSAFLPVIYTLAPLVVNKLVLGTTDYL